MWGFGFGAGRQRCRNVLELALEVVLELFGLTLLLPSLLRKTLLRDRRRRNGIALRFPQCVQLELNLGRSVRLLLQLLLQSLLSNVCLLLQLLLQPPFGSQRLLLQQLLKLLLLLQRLLLLLPLLVHERLEHPFAALIAPPRGFRGGAPILNLLLHQLLHLTLLLHEIEDHGEVGASV